jgi:DNA replication protein DnaC
MDNLGEILKHSTLPNDTPGPKSYEIDEYHEPSPAEKLMWRGVSDPGHTFETMKKVKGFENTLAAFKSIASKNREFNLLMVYGGVGNGKSRCCEAVVIELFNRGMFVSRQRWSDIVRRMKSLFGGRGDMPYEEYFDRLKRTPRLILDDVGSGSTLGPWEWGELEDIIDFRYERDLFTILTTNLDIKQFPERILSRFRDKSWARLILNEAADQRPMQGVN